MSNVSSWLPSINSITSKTQNVTKNVTSFFKTIAQDVHEVAPSVASDTITNLAICTFPATITVISGTKELFKGSFKCFQRCKSSYHISPMNRAKVQFANRYGKESLDTTLEVIYLFQKNLPQLTNRLLTKKLDHPYLRNVSTDIICKLESHICGNLLLLVQSYIEVKNSQDVLKEGVRQNAQMLVDRTLENAGVGAFLALYPALWLYQDYLVDIVEIVLNLLSDDSVGEPRFDDLPDDIKTIANALKKDLLIEFNKLMLGIDKLASAEKFVGYVIERLAVKLIVHVGKSDISNIASSVSALLDLQLEEGTKRLDSERQIKEIINNLNVKELLVKNSDNIVAGWVVELIKSVLIKALVPKLKDLQKQNKRCAADENLNGINQAIANRTCEFADFLVGLIDHNDDLKDKIISFIQQSVKENSLGAFGNSLGAINSNDIIKRYSCKFFDIAQYEDFKLNLHKVIHIASPLITTTGASLFAFFKERLLEDDNTFSARNILNILTLTDKHLNLNNKSYLLTADASDKFYQDFCKKLVNTLLPSGASITNDVLAQLDEKKLESITNKLKEISRKCFGTSEGLSTYLTELENSFAYKQELMPPVQDKVNGLSFEKVPFEDLHLDIKFIANALSADIVAELVKLVPGINHNTSAEAFVNYLVKFVVENLYQYIGQDNGLKIRQSFAALLDLQLQEKTTRQDVEKTIEAIVDLLNPGTILPKNGEKIVSSWIMKLIENHLSSPTFENLKAVNAKCAADENLNAVNQIVSQNACDLSELLTGLFFKSDRLKQIVISFLKEKIEVLIGHGVAQNFLGVIRYNGNSSLVNKYIPKFFEMTQLPEFKLNVEKIVQISSPLVTTIFINVVAVVKQQLVKKDNSLNHEYILNVLAQTEKHLIQKDASGAIKNEFYKDYIQTVAKALLPFKLSTNDDHLKTLTSKLKIFSQQIFGSENGLSNYIYALDTENAKPISSQEVADSLNYLKSDSDFITTVAAYIKSKVSADVKKNSRLIKVLAKFPFLESFFDQLLILSIEKAESQTTKLLNSNLLEQLQNIKLNSNKVELTHIDQFEKLVSNFSISFVVEALKRTVDVTAAKFSWPVINKFAVAIAALYKFFVFTVLGKILKFTGIRYATSKLINKVIHREREKAFRKLREIEKLSDDTYLADPLINLLDELLSLQVSA